MVRDLREVRPQRGKTCGSYSTDGRAEEVGRSSESALVCSPISQKDWARSMSRSIARCC